MILVMTGASKMVTMSDLACKVAERNFLFVIAEVYPFFKLATHWIRGKIQFRPIPIIYTHECQLHSGESRLISTVSLLILLTLHL